MDNTKIIVRPAGSDDAAIIAEVIAMGIGDEIGRASCRERV